MAQSRDKNFLKSLVASFHIEDPDGAANKKEGPQEKHQLVYTKRETYNLKNFNEEIYIKKDIGLFMEDPTLILNSKNQTLGPLVTELLAAIFRKKLFKERCKVNKTSTKLDKNKPIILSSKDEEKLRHIVRDVKSKMFSQVVSEDQDHQDKEEKEKQIKERHASEQAFMEKKASIISKEFLEADINLIANTLQGYVKIENHGNFNQNWLCVMSHSKHVNSQMVGITRLPKACELGPTCKEARLLFIILTPFSHSPLHSPLEIARTFGTILKTDNFIKALLNIDNHEEFKNLLNIEVYKRERYDKKHNSHGHAHDTHHASLHHTISNPLDVFDVESGSLSDENLETRADLSEADILEENKGVSVPYKQVFKTQSKDLKKKTRKRAKYKKSKQGISNQAFTPSDEEKDASLKALYDYDDIHSLNEMPNKHNSHAEENFNVCLPFAGIITDFKNRLPYYGSDWMDAFFKKKYFSKTQHKWVLRDKKEMWRLFRTINFVIVSVLLPILAFGNANDFNTGGKINVERTIFGQFLAGTFFSLFSSQPLGLVMTTPPITLLIKSVKKFMQVWFITNYDDCKYDKSLCEYSITFYQFYAITGVFIGLNLMLYSIFNLSRFLKYIYPSIEEIFAIWTAWAFVNQVLSKLVDVTNMWSISPTVIKDPNLDYDDIEVFNRTTLTDGATIVSYRDKVFLWYLLVLGTFMLSVWLYSMFKNTPYFTRNIRKLLADYSLLISVVVFSLVYNLAYKDISFEPYKPKFTDIFNGAVDASSKSSTSYKSTKSNILQFQDLTNLAWNHYLYAWGISLQGDYA